jgi:hypothetical protein
MSAVVVRRHLAMPPAEARSASRVEAGWFEGSDERTDWPRPLTYAWRGKLAHVRRWERRSALRRINNRE